MMSLLQIGPEWQKLLFGDKDFVFLAEVVLRTVVMYAVLLVGLRLMGKRGVRQLSVFELVVIIGLGSAAGDPMFYEEVGIVSAAVVFAVVIAGYRLTTWLTVKSKRVEKLVEGETVCLIADGKFCITDFDKEDLAQDEFFSELRCKSISHLGQVQRAYLEVSGEVSVFFYADEEVKYGLPVLPHECKHKLQSITEAGMYACGHCGHTEEISTPKTTYECPDCRHTEWVKAVNRKRIA